MNFEPIKIPKAWGEEQIIWDNDKFLVKKIKLDKGHRTSLQFHRKKREIICCLSGKIEFFHNEDGQDKTTVMQAGDYVIVVPEEKHRMTALEDSWVFECQDTGCQLDVVRESDDYRREGTNEP